MTYLIFCSFEVGGIPFRMAEILNRYGYRTYYISVHQNARGHDSARFHYDSINTEWNLSSQFSGNPQSPDETITKLVNVKKQYGITGCLATGDKAFLLAAAGIEYHYWSYGSDLDQVCFFNLIFHHHYKLWWNALQSFILRSYYNQNKTIQALRLNQVKSIKNSIAIMISPYQFKSYQKVCPGKKMFFFPHYFIPTDYKNTHAKKSINRDLVKKLIGTDRFFFSSTRHFWQGKNSLYSDNKGNDVVLYSFSKYLELTADTETMLVFVKKGRDVDATVALAEDLGLTQRVVWVDEMKREQLFTYYNAARIVFGQFGTPVLAFSALEPLTQATPCISYFLDGRTEGVPFYKNYPAIFNSRDSAVIAVYLAQLMLNQDMYQKACQAAWSWINNNCLETAFVESVTTILN